MSPLLQRVLAEADQLPAEEQWQVMNHLMTQLQHRATVTPKPTYSWEILEGVVPELLDGQDAQEWVNSLRDDWDEREQSLREPA